MSLHIDNEATLRVHLVPRGYNLFTGAGFSVCARNSSGARLPLGTELAAALRTAFDVDTRAALDLPRLYLLISRTQPDKLDALIREAYTVKQLDPRYRALTRIPPRTIITTNVDDVFQVTFKDSPWVYLNDVYATGTAPASDAAVDFIQVHGSVRAPERPLTFGPFDIAAASSLEPDRWHYVRQRLAETPTVFCGYSFGDAGTLEAIRGASPSRAVIGEAWVQVRNSPTAPDECDYYRALGYNVINGDTEELLDYFDRALTTPGPPRSQSHGPASNIPPIGNIARRPLEDFFTGAPPVWSDCYSTVVHRTHYYSTVVEAIASRRSSVLAGIPGCGKTTLLMQAAAAAPFRGTKMFFDSLTAAEASILASRIGSHDVLVLIDNVVRDVRAIEALLDLPHTVVVAADRDFAVSSVSHHLSEWGVEVIGVTAQSAQDLVSIWRTIPERLRRQSGYRIPEMAWGLEPSLYEFVKANVQQSFLAERLSAHVNDISNRQPLLAEFVILACYLRHAGSAISTDLAIAFFRDDDIDYHDIASMSRTLGELLHDEGRFGADMDYVAARSPIVAEEILQGSRSALVRRVLDKFFHNVSDFRIPSFDSFRRRGFDSRIFKHAFPRCEDGIALYDEILESQRTVYIEQQKALFLEHHQRYVEGLDVIAAARSRWRGRPNWTIENTYFKMLFRVNFDRRDDPSLDARILCRRALDGLRAAFRGDGRKGHHSLVFGDCALLYSDVWGAEPEAAEYLRDAQRMLEDVIRAESFLDRPKYLVRQVRRRIGQLG